MGFAEFRKQQKQQQRKKAGDEKALLMNEEGKEVSVSVSTPPSMEKVGDMFGLDDVWYEGEGGKGVVLELVGGKRYFVRGKERAAKVNSVRRVGFGYSSEVLKHTVGMANHVERPERIVKTVEVVRSSCVYPLLTLLRAQKTADPTLLPQVHDATLLGTVLPTHCYTPYPRSLYCREEPKPQQCYSRTPRLELPRDTYYCDGSRDAVLASLGMMVEACDMVCTGGLDSAFCLTRPPGHHCTRRQPQGFCLVNNVAVAARYVQSKYPKRTIAIIDYDVHHGDGTQEIFEGDGSVYFISLHRHDKGVFYPHTGPATDMGMGRGRGAIFNIAFDTDHGTDRVIGDTAFEVVATRFLQPLLRALNVDLVLISSGFDAAENDPLGRMSVRHGFARVTHHILQAVPNTVMLLEGGYNTDQVAQGTLSCLRSLLDITPHTLTLNEEQRAWALATLRRTVQHHLDEVSPLTPVLRQILQGLQ